MLHLDGARAVDLEHQNGAIGPPGALRGGGLTTLAPPRPHHSVRSREAGKLLAHHRRPFAQQRRDGEASRPGDWVEHVRHISADGLGGASALLPSFPFIVLHRLSRLAVDGGSASLLSPRPILHHGADRGMQPERLICTAKTTQIRLLLVTIGRGGWFTGAH